MGSVKPKYIRGSANATPIKSEIAVGELVINTADGRLYTKTEAEEVVRIGADEEARALADLAVSLAEAAEPAHALDERGWSATGASGSRIAVGAEQVYRDFESGVRQGALDVVGYAADEFGYPLPAEIVVSTPSPSTGSGLVALASSGSLVALQVYGDEQLGDSFGDVGPNTAALFARGPSSLAIGLQGTFNDQVVDRVAINISSSANVSVSGNLSVGGVLSSEGALTVGGTLGAIRELTLSADDSFIGGDSRFVATTSGGGAATAGRTAEDDDPPPLNDIALLHGGVNYFGGSDGNTVIYAGTDGAVAGGGSLILATGGLTPGAARVRILSNGRVGVGLENPSSLLHVNGQITVNPGAIDNLAVRFTNDENTGFYTPFSDRLTLVSNGQDSLTVMAGKVGVNTINPTYFFDINADKFRLQQSLTPTQGVTPGTGGVFAWDENYLYLCVGVNAWRRIPLSTF